ncbi:hypothetical protein DFH06DRAFT_655690 [Mycena polygramma]|nr:hypothetical protein DFH06DRAFT_655690 [Mycena polygramma]
MTKSKMPANGSNPPPARAPRRFKITAIRLDSNLEGSIVCHGVAGGVPIPSNNLHARTRQEVPIEAISISEDKTVNIVGTHRRKWWHYRQKQFSDIRRLKDLDPAVSDGSQIMLVLYQRQETVFLTFQEIPNIEPPGIQISAISLDVLRLTHSDAGLHYLSLSVHRDRHFKARIDKTQEKYPLSPPFTLHYNGSLRIQIHYRRRRWMWKKLIIETDLSYRQAYRELNSGSSPDTTIRLKTSPKITAHLTRFGRGDNTGPGSETLLTHVDAAKNLVQRKKRLVESFDRYRGFFETFMRYVGAASEMNPYAKAVYMAVNQLYKDLKARKDCDILVLQLLDDIATSFRHVTNVENFKDRIDFNKSVRDLKRLAEDTVNLIRKYYDGTTSSVNREEFMDLRKRLERFNLKFSNDLQVHSAQALITLLDKFMDQEFKKVLAVLRITARRPKPIGGCSPGTRTDVFSQIIKWLNSPGKPNILWIEGHPGSGKTSIASSLVEILKKSKGKTRLGSSFFFERDNSDFTAASVFWSQVAYDLAQIYRPFASGVVAVLENGDIDFNTTPLDVQFTRLIAENLGIMAAQPDPPRFVVIIDAIDECGGLGQDSSRERRTLLSTIHRWSEMDSAKFKLVVISRNEAPISRVLIPIAARIELSLSTRAASEDIRRYLGMEMKRIVDEYVQDGREEETLRTWLTSALLRQLTKMAGGLFVWAKTLINFLEAGNPRDQLELILGGEDLGENGDINVLYRKILTIAFNHNGPPKESVLKDFRAVVGIIVVAKRPLDSNEEIQHQMDLAGVKESAWKDIRRRLASVMEHGVNLRFQHSSFVEFLISDACPREFRIKVKTQKKNLTLAALDAMTDSNTGLHFNMWRLSTSYSSNSTISAVNLKKRRSEYISSSLLWSCRCWADHFDTNIGDAEIVEKVELFLETRFLYWVEIFSLFSDSGDQEGLSLDYAVNQLYSLVDWAQQAPTVAKFARDAIEFLTEFKDVIQTSTPHIYLSALAFTHPTSEVYKAFGHLCTMAVSGFPEQAPQSEGPGMGKITAVACSPDGLVASASTDRSIRIWSATKILILTGHQDTINSVAFSTSGFSLGCLVSGSNDATARVWERDSGRCIVVFESHGEAVTAVSFSPAGDEVMSASKDGTLRFWDPISGTQKHNPVRRNQGPLTCATFLDEDSFVSGAENGSYKRLAWVRNRDFNVPPNKTKPPSPIPQPSMAGVVVTGNNYYG